MRRTCIFAFTALLAGKSRHGPVIIGTQNPDAARHEQRAMRDRAEARSERHEAEHRAAMGDYRGAAESNCEARQDWHDARRQEHRAQEDSGGMVYGR